MRPSYGRTQEQHNNTQKLIDGLKALPDDYELLNMEQFAENYAWAKNATPENPCGTCMCVVGHGPSLGIPFIDEDEWSWPRYSRRAFGFTLKNNSAWRFCFSSAWCNDIDEAIARLEIAQRGEIPDTWDYDNIFINTPEKTTNG